MLSVKNKPLMLSVVTLNTVILIVIMLSLKNKPLMLSVVILNAIMPSVIMVSVVAPWTKPQITG
jgi:hypothetical protein